MSHHTVASSGEYNDWLISKFFKRYTTISYKVNNTLGLHIKNNKDILEKNLKTRVYELCGTCSKSYVGQTDKSFKIRINKHLSGYNKKTVEKSAYVDHLVTEKQFLTKQFNGLHIVQRGNKLNTLEQLEINKLCRNNAALDNYLLDTNKSRLCY